MYIKGISVKTIPEFVKEYYPERYNEWFKALPNTSKNIFCDVIMSNKWYPVSAALVNPIKIAGRLFFNNDSKKAGWQMGRYAADFALKGIYKIYVKLGSPGHIIDRASRIMSAYFQPSELKVVTKEKYALTVHITLFPEPDEVLDHNIAGWMERALEISGCKNLNIEISKSLALHDDVTEFKISWEI